MEPNIAMATLHDIPELARLRWQMHTEDHPDPGETFDGFAEGFAAFAREALSGQMWHVWVAEGSGLLVGSIWLQLVERVPRPDLGWGHRPFGYVTNAYVEPPHRGKGLGSRMLGEIVAWGRAAELNSLIAWPDDRSTSLFARAGFTPDSEALTVRFENP